MALSKRVCLEAISGQLYHAIPRRRSLGPPSQRLQCEATYCFHYAVKSNMAVVPHPAYSLDLAPVTFPILFPRLKIKLKR